MALTNTERQRRYRERRAAGEPVRTFRRPQDRRSRPQRWADALLELRALQAEYEVWYYDLLPKSLAGSRTAELLKNVCELDLAAFDVELPRGFGRDTRGEGDPRRVHDRKVRRIRLQGSRP